MSITEQNAAEIRDAVNFWSEFEGAVFVFCSATQLCFEKIGHHRKIDHKQNNLSATVPMVEDERFASAFVRTEFHNDTGALMDTDAAAEYIADKAHTHSDVWFLANTKGCAASIHTRVRESCGDGFDVSYLSTNLYPEHRRTIIAVMKKGVIPFPRPEECTVKRRIKDMGIKPFVKDDNLIGLREFEQELDGKEDG